MKESAVIGEKKQSPLKGKICRPHFPSSWEPGQRCDNVPNRERETVRAERKEDERRDKWRENGAFCLIMFEGRTESPEQSYREKLNIFMNLFSLSSLAAAGGSNHVTLDWLAGWLAGWVAGWEAGGATSTSEKPALPRYTFPRRAVCSITIPRADAGRK